MKRTLLLSLLALVLSASAASAQIRSYQNYDFVPGTDLIFEDYFVSDLVGEWPAHWELLNGQGAVNEVDGNRLLVMNAHFTVEPRMTSEKYLGDNFSVEFDGYVSEAWGGWPFTVRFFDDAENEALIAIDGYTVTFSNSQGRTLSAANEFDQNTLYHFAIAYKDGQAKIYANEKRLLVVPNLGLRPDRVHFNGGAEEAVTSSFGGVRIATGAQMNMLNALLTDGVVVTYGITFDVGKATLKPASMGTINELAAALKAQADLRLEISGHTDSDGSDALNLKLSQDRAAAVVAQLVSMGIAADRLVAVGKGETAPIAPNTTFEGKAKNRRVEFRKL